MGNNQKILKRLDQLETIGRLITEEATMLKQELLGVVSGNSTRKGKIKVEQAIRTIANRSKNRVK